jgi:hypothetical protein
MFSPSYSIFGFIKYHGYAAGPPHKKKAPLMRGLDREINFYFANSVRITFSAPPALNHSICGSL